MRCSSSPEGVATARRSEAAGLGGRRLPLIKARPRLRSVVCDAALVLLAATGYRLVPARVRHLAPGSPHRLGGSPGRLWSSFTRSKGYSEAAGPYGPPSQPALPRPTPDEACPVGSAASSTCRLRAPQGTGATSQDGRSFLRQPRRSSGCTDGATGGGTCRGRKIDSRGRTLSQGGRRTVIVVGGVEAALLEQGVVLYPL